MKTTTSYNWISATTPALPCWISPRVLDDGGCLELHQKRRTRQTRDLEKRRCGTAARCFQPGCQHFHRRKEIAQMRGVVVETHHVRKVAAALPQDRLQIVQRLPNLRHHVALVHRIAVHIDGALARAIDRSLGSADSLGLDETELVLPRPRVDHVSLHRGLHG